MECLSFFGKYSEQKDLPFSKVVVAMFSEQIAKRAFTTFEFGQMPVKGSPGDVPDTPNDILLEKAWTVYNNICKFGYEFTATKSKVFSV